MTFRNWMKETLKRFKHKDASPCRDELVTSLILNTANLALEKGKYVEFAPIKGTCGNIKLSGVSLPVFTYTVFEKKIMEFVDVRVEVSKPDRIQFSSKVFSEDLKENGKEIETTDKYKEPFNKLSEHLYRYFPFPRDIGGKSYDMVLEPSKVQIQSESARPS